MKKKIPNLTLETPVQYIKGVGPKLGEILGKRGIKTVLDLLENYPRTYEDRRFGVTIAQLQYDQLVSLKAQIIKIQGISLGRTQRKIYDITLKDATGVIHCKFFRIPYKGYFERFKLFQEIRVVGKVINYRGNKEFHHPDLRDMDPEEELQDEIIPIYIEMDGVSSSKWQKIIDSIFLDIYKDPQFLKYDKIPYLVREKNSLIGYTEALKKIHRPPKNEFRLFLESKSESHRRLIFEEFFFLEVFLASKKLGLKKEQSLPIILYEEMKKKILQNLPFQLTQGQRQALAEVQDDFLTGHPMHRLVQGDVGCGKTLVAFLSCAIVAENQLQSCLMVPTEILAEQHFKNAQKYLLPAGLRIEILSGKTKNSERKEILEKLARGEIDLLIGTHALIEDDVIFQKLAFVVIDEQHRFGVNQRLRLKQKGPAPHFLIMTATPIPRTLAMTAFGDLDISIINELPPGRAPIQTRVAFQNKRQQALDFLQEQIKKGRQGYMVFPLVEESEKLDLKNATDEYERLKIQYPGIRWALLHGKMKSSEKEEIMNQFRNHQFDVLVSTTVIEVGVDVPNANIMMIEHSERFGLSQLHQLRGRVGRGEHKSFCILLMGYAVSPEAKERVMFMESTTDGFKLAEFDLELRGPGEYLGTKQSGLIGFKIADIVKNQDLLLQARQSAFEILVADPELKFPDNHFIKEYVNKKRNADLG